MRIFITGGAGLIGRAIAGRLLEGGHEVYLTDLAAETDVPNTTYAVCDILDFNAVQEQMRGCEAVVHMAALRSPMLGTGQDVFRINTVGTFNVFEAAAKEGIRRIVQASSINAIGCAYNVGDFSPRYLPVDEDHPLFTNDAYSFSKQQVEEIGAYYWRRERISSVAFRFPGVYPPEWINNPQHHERQTTMRQFLDRFAALSEAEQRRLVAEVREHALAYRTARNMEYPVQTWNTTPPEGIDPALWRAYTFDRFNLWTAISVLDAAIAIENALLAEYEGSHPLFVNNTENMVDYPSRKLAEWFFPEVTEYKTALEGTEALVSINRARQLIGFEPQYALNGQPHAENR
jgi:nucleoside-diphosphate-sugar epimerase